MLIGLITATWYSFTWAERFLDPIEVGMTADEVKRLVGYPLKIIQRANHTEAWYYDRWWSGDAIVYFDIMNHVSALETD